jgi:hypothetical protein
MALLKQPKAGMANMRVLVMCLLAFFLQPASAADAPAAPAADKSENAESKEKKPAFKPPPGYRVKISGWDIVYCRKTPVLGSRFSKEVCMTEAQLKEHMAANEEMRRNKDQTSRVCAGGACGDN